MIDVGFTDTLPFLRGETYFGLGGKPSDSAGDNLVGREYVHQDDTYETGSLVRIRVCRNVSGIKLIPGKCVTFRARKGRLLNCDVVGYATRGSKEPSAIVDDLLKFNVPKDDLFYCVVSGPCLAYPIDCDIDIGQHLHPTSCGASTSTELSDMAGRLCSANFDGLTQADLAFAIGHVVGKAMSAVTSWTAYRDRILIQAGFGPWQ